MKRIVQVEVEYCDVCESAIAWMECLGCGKHFCRECEKKGLVTEFCTGVYGGSLLYFCPECEQAFSNTGAKPEITKKLYDTLVSVRSLTREYAGFHAAFDIRRKDVDAACEAAAMRYNNAKKLEQAKATGEPIFGQRV
jgi:hypothetical protein